MTPDEIHLTVELDSAYARALSSDGSDTEAAQRATSVAMRLTRCDLPSFVLENVVSKGGLSGIMLARSGREDLAAPALRSFMQIIIDRDWNFGSPTGEIGPELARAILEEGAAAIAAADRRSSQHGPAVSVGSAANTSSSPAAWHRDPTGRFEYRYWDGDRWTAHVAKNNTQGLDAI